MNDVTVLQAEVSEEDLPRFQGMSCILSDGSRHHGDERTKRGFCYIPPVRYPDGKRPGCPVDLISWPPPSPQFLYQQLKG